MMGSSVNTYLIGTYGGFYAAPLDQDQKHQQNKVDRSGFKSLRLE